jgi:hypothetical protein
MGKYCTAVRKLEDKFEGLEVHHVERDRNTATDALSKLGSSRTLGPAWSFHPRSTAPEHFTRSGRGMQYSEPTRVRL